MNQRSNNPDWQERIPDVLICVQNDTIDKEKFNTAVQIIRERIVEHQRQGLIIGYIKKQSLDKTELHLNYYKI